jgi:hypothetical protein
LERSALGVLAVSMRFDVLSPSLIVDSSSSKGTNEHAKAFVAF